MVMTQTKYMNRMNITSYGLSWPVTWNTDVLKNHWFFSALYVKQRRVEELVNAPAIWFPTHYSVKLSIPKSKARLWLHQAKCLIVSPDSKIWDLSFILYEYIQFGIRLYEIFKINYSQYSECKGNLFDFSFYCQLFNKTFVDSLIMRETN